MLNIRNAQKSPLTGQIVCDARRRPLDQAPTVAELIRGSAS
jgi:hypothetical protein